MAIKEVEVVKRWTTKAGLEAVVSLIRGQHHCGYVRIPKEHAFYRVGLEDESYIGDELKQVKVHGGLTYARDYLAGVAEEVEGHWWIGFDCAHAWDLDKGEAERSGGFFADYATFKDVDYCVNECESMAEQVVAWKAAI